MKQSRLPLVIQVISYTLAIFLPPLIFGVIFGISAISDVMMIRDPEPLSEEVLATFNKDISPSPPSSLPLAQIMVNKGGAQVNDTLASYAILRKSGLFQVEITNPKSQELIPLTGALSLLPHSARLQKDSSTENPLPQLLAIPALMNGGTQEDIRWLTENTKRIHRILTLGDGILVPAQLNLLETPAVRSHFLSQKNLAERFPQYEFKEDVRYTSHSKWITTGGGTSAFDGTFATVESFSTSEKAQNLAQELGLSFNESSQRRDLSFRQWFTVFTHAAFGWGRRDVGILVYPGVDEIYLAALLDTLPRTFTIRTVTLAPERVPIESKEEAYLVPSLALKDAPKLDHLIIPPGSSAQVDSFLESEAYQNWKKDIQDPPILNMNAQENESPYMESLKLISEWESPHMAKIVGTLTEYPSTLEKLPESTSTRWIPIDLRPFLLSLLGVIAVRRFQKRKIAPRT